MLIHSHGKNEKWHINYLSWETNEKRERYNLITTLIFWQLLDAIQVILSSWRQRDYFRGPIMWARILSTYEVGWSESPWHWRGWRQTECSWQPVICFLNEIIFHACMRSLPLFQIYVWLQLPCYICLEIVGIFSGQMTNLWLAFQKWTFLIRFPRQWF